MESCREVSTEATQLPWGDDRNAPMSRPRLQAYVNHDVQKRLRAYCAADGLSESAVVERAVREHLEGDAKDNVLIMRRLDRLARAGDRQERDLGVLSEAFDVFVRLWLAYAPVIEDAAAARQAAKHKHQSFLDHVARQYGAGERLVDQVVREKPSLPT